MLGAFKNDQEVKKDAAKLFQKKPKEKKSSGNNHKAEAILDSGRPKYKPVGKIDLDQLNKPTLRNLLLLPKRSLLLKRLLPSAQRRRML